MKADKNDSTKCVCIDKHAYAVNEQCVCKDPFVLIVRPPRNPGIPAYPAYLPLNPPDPPAKA